MKTVVERFAQLKRAADRHAKNPGLHGYDVDLHTEALSYADAVRKVARRKREQ
jgi:hypothetical protein